MSALTFAWGLTRGDVSAESDLVSAPGLITYNGQSINDVGGVTSHDARSLCAIPENKDDICLVIAKPTRTLYLSTHCEGVTNVASVGLAVRVVYDVVSLTSSEQADLFNYCCT
jgi:hypothetical protein